MRFRTKLVIVMTLMLSLSFGIGGSLLIASSFRASLEAEKASQLRSFNSLLGAVLLLDDDRLAEKYMSAVSSQDTNLTAAELVTVGRFETTVVYSNDRAHLLPAEDEDFEPSRCTGRLLQSGEKTYYLLSGSVDAPVGIVRLRCAYDITGLYDARDAQLGIFRSVFVCVAALGLAAAFFVSTLLTRRLGWLSAAVRRIASGELSSRAAFRSSDEVGALAADFDVMAERLERSYGELSDAMERQEEFIGSFAHEMKTPMTSIIGYADMLRSQELAPDERREAAGYIFSEGKRLENLSFKLLDLLLLRRGEVTLSPCSPRKIITDVVHTLQPIMKKQDIVLQCRCEQGSCMMDADLIKSLLMNLIDNARKAFDAGGNIFIISEMTADGCTVNIIDNGRGIPQESIEKLTEAFYRVDKSRSRTQGGVGLGLALCAEIAHRHGGTIGFKSTVGKGTRVTVVLKGGRA